LEKFSPALPNPRRLSRWILGKIQFKFYSNDESKESQIDRLKEENNASRVEESCASVSEDRLRKISLCFLSYLLGCLLLL